MAKDASASSIKHCAMHLVEKACPLMPLTSDGKTSFDLAELYNNDAYECVKPFLYRCEFSNLTPKEVSSRNEAKTFLSDFGLSRREGVELKSNNRAISPRWTAPECSDRHRMVSSLADVWSFGVVIWEIFSFGAKPYEADLNNNSQVLIDLLKNFLLDQTRRFSRLDYCSKGMYDLMVSFSYEERKAWKQAKEEYLQLFPQSIISLTNAPEYSKVVDIENDDKNK